MKVKYRKELKNGKRHVLVELDEGETLLTFDEDGYYKMGYPFDEVVRGNNITESSRVMWCVLEQKWVE
jgi:hypothetical protein